MTWGALRMMERPSAIIAPQLAALGLPSPRNESAASCRIAAATITAASARSGVRAFGSTTVKAIASGGRPTRRETST